MSKHRPVAVVTGAARRVGRAIALDLAATGFDLVLTCRTHRRDAEQTLAAAGVEGRILQLDLSEPDAIARIAGSLTDLPRIDALVHNASTYAPSPWGTINAEKAITDFRVNALVPLLLSQALAGKMAKSTLPGGGVIVCLTDIQSLGRPARGYASYAMSKAALNQMIESLAVEMAPAVRVVGIAPGVVAWPEGTQRKEIQAYEKKIPLARSGTPEDAARCVRWLITEATYITGEIIRLDGGRWLR